MRGNRFVAAAIAVGAAAAATARADTFDVNVVADVADPDLGDGSCDVDPATDGVQCSLRSALQNAALTPGADVVNVPAGKYRLTLRGSGEDQGARGDLDVVGDVTIEGAGAAQTILDARRLKDRVLDLQFGGQLTVRGVAITRGKTPRGESGGGIRSSGTLLVERCVVAKCSAKDDAGGIDAGGPTTLRATAVVGNKTSDDGAGLDTDEETVVLERCLFSKNKARDEGGGLENSGGNVTVENSTFSGNSARSEGGAVVNEDGGTTTLVHCTFTKNRARSGAAVSSQAGTVVLRGSLFAKNGKKTCGGVATSLGGNVDDGTSCGFAPGGADRSAANVRLGKLVLSGGDTGTHELLPDSDGIDLIPEGPDCPTVDQRGFARTGPCDAGAFEVGATPN